MADRIVLAFCWRLSTAPGFLERALAVEKSAEALGGALSAWGGETFVLDFAPDEIEAIIAFAIEQAKAGEVRFGIGLAQGEITPRGERGLSWGAPIVTAERLARIAPLGEVLVDPELPAFQTGDLVTRGRRRGRLGEGVVVRGHRLDLGLPLRRDALQAVRRIVAEPPLIGREDVFEKLSVPLGCVGLVRAASGSGGSRLLSEASRRLAPSQTITLAPGFLPREPLGALRNGLTRAMLKAPPPELSERLAHALNKLLSGEGIDTNTAADLIDAWLGPVEGRSGLLIVDDAAQIDTSTLEVVSSAILPRGFFRALVRIGEDEPLPPALGSIPVASEVALGPLSREAAEELAREFCDGALTASAAKRWARRGGGSPLAIKEAIAEGLATGELRWSDDLAFPRDNSSGRGKAQPASTWMEKRLPFLAPHERAWLVALAYLGGDAPSELADMVATLMEGPFARAEVVAEPLTLEGFIVATEEGWCAFASRTAMFTILDSVDEASRPLWHRMAGRVLEQHVGLLGLAQPAMHAAMAGEWSSAAGLAAEAARAAASAGLKNAARMLANEARTLDPGVELPDLPDDAQADGQSILSMIGSEIDKPKDTMQGLEGLEADEINASVAEAFAALGEDVEASEDPDVMAERLSRLMKQALVEGDLATLEQLIVRLRVTGEHDELVERMGAFVLLGRGEHGDALRKLRAAAEAKATSSARARARLSYGIALASAGDVQGAMLESLSALARAREAKDRRGEQACARFLAYLAAAVGEPGAASVWAKVAAAAG